jgi:hypothetical protein
MWLIWQVFVETTAIVRSGQTALDSFHTSLCSLRFSDAHLDSTLTKERTSCQVFCFAKSKL